jgi:predicted aldo/keto reductase-like oxidoreductase
MTQPNAFSRRDFLKALGAATAGTLLAPSDSNAEVTGESDQMPTRPFGKTGIDVPILGFGGSLHLPQLMLRQAFKWGVTYWDTANSYMGGNSEKRIGNYLMKFPQDRQKIFLVTKSHAWTIKGMGADLEQSLERMQTDYVDLFLVHSVSGMDELDDATKTWAAKKKAAGKFRLFGFSTHSNMEACMLGASKLGWVDAIMMSYNFRLMHTDAMKRAVDACTKAGIGLTAMKTQGGGSIKTSSATEGALVERLLEKGFTDAQAKLKAVWENPDIACICSEMPNMSILMANVSAALNRTRLSTGDMQLLRRYAHETRSDYCKGCARICEATLEDTVPIADIMRHLMYWRSYGDRHRAAQYFRQMPAERRLKMATADYLCAEQICPQNMAIGRLIRTALTEFYGSDRDSFIDTIKS